MQGKRLCYAVLAAAGAGTRMSADRPKQFLELAGQPVWRLSLAALLRCECVAGAVVAVPERYAAECRAALGDTGGKPVQIVSGGADRAASVYAALMTLPAECTHVLVHDAVRPFVTEPQVLAVAAAAYAHRAAVLAVPVKDTVKQTDGQGFITSTPVRERLLLAQTPQGFERVLLTEAYAQAFTQGFAGTDDSSYVERLHVKPAVVAGDYRNIKLTTAEDWALAERFYGEGF